MEGGGWGDVGGLPPIILATQEAEIKRITVQSQPGQIVGFFISKKKASQKKG
jgi:hypothetical protein